MKKLEQVISFGNRILEATKEKYLTDFEKFNDKLVGYQVIKALTDSDEEQKRLENKVNGINSQVQYITFIQKELNNITNFVKTANTNDYQDGCMYFGNGTLYYSEEFLKYKDNDAYEIILNHIIHYTGCLYVINSSEVRLSYILLAKSICRAESVDYRDYRNIYLNNKDKFKQIIFDIKSNYPEFVIRNRKFMKFIKFNPNSDNKLLSYRIVLSNYIELKNMNILIESDKIKSIQELTTISEIENKQNFSLTA